MFREVAPDGCSVKSFFNYGIVLEKMYRNAYYDITRYGIGPLRSKTEKERNVGYA